MSRLLTHGMGERRLRAGQNARHFFVDELNMVPGEMMMIVMLRNPAVVALIDEAQDLLVIAKGLTLDPLGNKLSDGQCLARERIIAITVLLRLLYDSESVRIFIAYVLQEIGGSP